jgi:hypothetical protein
MGTPLNIFRIAPLVLAGSVAGWQVQAADIDFEGLSEGEIVDEVSTGAGVSGDLNGHVDVFGFNPGFGVGTNTAVVFDSDCPPGGIPTDCSGTDVDLGTPNEDFSSGPGVGTGGESGMPFENNTALGNILIVAEDLVDDSPADGLVDDPDDDDMIGQFLEFDFGAVKRNGKGTVTVNSVTYVDNDEGEFNAQIEMSGPGIADQFIALTPVGDNGVNTIDGIGIEGVELLRVVLNGSGAVASVVINEEVERSCWVTLGGFRTAEVTTSSGPKLCTFGGNVGPPPNGALEVNFHSGALEGQKFHTNDIHVVECTDMGSTGPQQPGGKKGLVIDTLFFDCTGRLNNEDGFTCSGYFKDAGEPAGKKGNDRDAINVQIFDEAGAEVASCIGELAGGNIQIHPPVGKP